MLRKNGIPLVLEDQFEIRGVPVWLIKGDDIFVNDILEIDGQRMRVTVTQGIRVMSGGPVTGIQMEEVKDETETPS